MKDFSVQIRNAEKSEAEALDALLTKLIQYETQFDSNLEKEYQVKNNYHEVIGKSGHKLLVAEADGQIVGFLYGFVYQIPGMFRQPVACLDALFVSEPYRNHGIARALFLQFKQFATENHACRIELKVLSQNESALHFYQKLSFQERKKHMELDCF